MKAYQVQYPSVLDDPISHVFAQSTSDYDFIIYDNNSTTNMVCSESRLPRLPSPIPSSTSVLTSVNKLTKFRPRMKSTNGSRAFEIGLAFCNIQEYRMWSTHVDCIITIEPTEHAVLDCIRKPMFRAITFQKVAFNVQR